MLQLNLKGRLIPDYIEATDTIEYDIEKYFDLDEILRLMNVIDFPAW